MSSVKTRLLYLAFITYAVTMIPIAIFLSFFAAFTGFNNVGNAAAIAWITGVVSGVIPWVWNGEGDAPTPITHKGRVRALSDRDLAEFEEYHQNLDRQLGRAAGINWEGEE